MILIDISVCCFSVWFSYYLRIGNFSSPIEWMMFPFFISSFVSTLIFWFLGVYKNIFRYFDRYNISKLFGAIAVYSIFFFLIVTIFSIPNVPRTIGIIQPILYLLFLYIIRSIFSFLLNYEHVENPIKKNVALIYGSGNAGVQLLNFRE